MIQSAVLKNWKILPLLALPFLAWLIPGSSDFPPGDSPSEKINLALRRTADALLRLSGDGTSRIPAIEQCGAGVWRVRLERPFDYERLPELLQSSLDLHGIREPYQVAVRRCEDLVIDLGYHQLDFLENKSVPCGGRDLPEGCRFIEISFLENPGAKPLWAAKTALLLLFAGGLAAFWFFRKRGQSPAPQTSFPEIEWLEFGNSRLDAAGQILFCAGVRQELTFREAKLLRLFASRPGQLLERDFIIQEVWADEGVLVGRSVDVFVSRLRKKLAADSSVGIVAVHGVGYRLEVVRNEAG